MLKSVLLTLLAGTICAPSARAKPPLQRLIGAPTHIEPLRIARAAIEDGKVVMVGDWIPYTGGAGVRSARYNAPLWDCYGRSDGPRSHCFPPGTTCLICNGTNPDIGPTDWGGRWYFGHSHHNPTTVDNIESFVGNPCQEIDEVNASFYCCGGANWFLVAHFIFEEFTDWDPDTGLCTDPSFYTTACAGNGVILDFGYVDCFQSCYPAYCADGLIAAGIGMYMPADDSDGDGLVDGSHGIFYLSRDGAGNIVRHPGPIQPMLWGTGEDSGEARPGTHGRYSYDDDNPADGVWDNPAECYDYTYPARCPPTLGKAVAFLAPFCPADYNRDGFVDGIDSDMFANDFESADPLVQARADFNDDCFVDGMDADLFYNEFESSCP